MSSIDDHVRVGLGDRPRRLDPVLFYDSRGSALFEAITELDEYYLTRTERALLRGHADRLAARCEEDVTVVELGSGSSKKTEVLLAQLVATKRHVRYVPADVSRAAVDEAVARLAVSLPALEVRPLIAEYGDALARAPALVDGQCLTLFLGSTLGNFEPAGAIDFLGDVRAVLTHGDLLLLGLDLVKPRSILERAYDDAAGITADFNKNVLVRINRELAANFDVDAFEHRAVYDTRRQRIEMHLVSSVDQRARIDALGVEVELAAGETIHTESSYKFTRADITAMASQAGLTVAETLTDAADLFSLSVMTPRGSA